MPPCHPRCHPYCYHEIRARKKAGITEHPPPDYDIIHYRGSRWIRPTPPSSRDPSPERRGEGCQASTTATTDSSATTNDTGTELTIKKKSDHQASTTTDSSDTTNGTDTEITIKKKMKERKISRAFHRGISRLSGRFSRVLHRQESPDTSQPPPHPQAPSTSSLTAVSCPVDPPPDYTTLDYSVESTVENQRQTGSDLETITGVERSQQRDHQPSPADTRLVSDNVAASFLVVYLEFLWEFLYEGFIFLVGLMIRNLNRILGHPGQRTRPAVNPRIEHERELK